jgi:hypothetical protein
MACRCQGYRATNIQENQTGSSNGETYSILLRFFEVLKTCIRNYSCRRPTGNFFTAVLDNIEVAY